jgi:hypothetical protein
MATNQWWKHRAQPSNRLLFYGIFHFTTRGRYTFVYIISLLLNILYINKIEMTESIDFLFLFPYFSFWWINAYISYKYWWLGFHALRLNVFPISSYSQSISLYTGFRYACITTEGVFIPSLRKVCFVFLEKSFK